MVVVVVEGGCVNEKAEVNQEERESSMIGGGVCEGDAWSVSAGLLGYLSGR